MKLVIEVEPLRRLLAHVRGVVEFRNSIPILGNVKLVAATGMLAVTGTDLDAEISDQAPAMIEAGGATTVPGHTLYEIVRKLPDGGQAELQTESAGAGRLTLRCGRSRFTLAALLVEDFPALTVGELPHHFHLEAAALRLLIDATRFAVSTEETRYYLNGIYLHPAQSEHGAAVLRAVATDGHRLARADAPLPEGAAGMPGIIVPRKAVAEVRKLAEAADTIEVAVSGTQVRINAGGAVLTSKLIDGTFPDYERVIPAGNDNHVEIERGPLTAAVARVSAISTDRSRAIKLDLAPGRPLELSATSPEHGSAGEEVDARYAGPPLTIGFNARYLIEILEQLSGDVVRLSIGDAQGPVLLRQPGDDAILTVLMPMRVA